MATQNLATGATDLLKQNGSGALVRESVYNSESDFTQRFILLLLYLCGYYFSYISQYSDRHEGEADGGEGV